LGLLVWGCWFGAVGLGLLVWGCWFGAVGLGLLVWCLGFDGLFDLSHLSAARLAVPH
jgi:hypothetical protein